MGKITRFKRFNNIIILCILVLDWSSPVIFADDIENNYVETPIQETTTFPGELAELIPLPDVLNEVDASANPETPIDTTNTIIPMPDSSTGVVEPIVGEGLTGTDIIQDAETLTGYDGSLSSGEVFTGSEDGTGNQIFIVDQNTLNQETIVPLVDHETVVENFKLVAPTIQRLYDEEGRFDPTTLQSFVTAGGVPSITYCSMITRNNIATLLGISPTDSSLAWGDATTLIQDMMNEGRGYTVLRYDIEKTLLEAFAASKATIFDVYSYNGNLSDGNWQNGHRITIVLGTDNLLYVLDPIRAFTHEPILLSKYIQYFLEYDTIYINKQAYSPYGLVNKGIEQTISIFNTGIVVSIPSGTVIEPIGQTGLTMDSIVEGFIVKQNEFLYNNGDAFIVKDNADNSQTTPTEVPVEVQTGTTSGEVVVDSVFTGEGIGELIIDTSISGSVDIVELPNIPSDTPLVIVEQPADVIIPSGPDTVLPEIQIEPEIVIENIEPIAESISEVLQPALGNNTESIPTLVETLVDTTILVPITEIVPQNYTLQIELPFEEILGSESNVDISQTVSEIETIIDEQVTNSETVPVTYADNIVDVINPETPLEFNSDQTRFPTLFDGPGIDLSDISNVVDIETMSEYEQVIMNEQVAAVEPIIIGAYKIGNTDSHLEFSKPVKIEIAVNQPEGEEIAILVKHEGYTEYSVEGLAVDESASCSGGISSSENNIAYVKDGKVTFYTCGASDFLATISAGTATITYPLSGSTIYQIQPRFLGTGTTNGAIITVSYSGGAVIGTASVQGGNWGLFANAPLPEGDHTICISGGGGCRSFTISTFVETKGDIDNSFTGTFANNTVQTTNLFSDNSVLVGGLFSTFNGTAKANLTATTITGANKSTFAGSFSNNQVASSLILPDGDVMIGGTFTTFNGVARTRLTRLTSTGALDPTFAGTFANNTVSEIAVQPDGKILVGGALTTFGGVTRNRLARITATGALDTTFTGTFANNTINAVVIQPDGKILVGGSFTTMNGVVRNRIARLTNTGALDTTFTGTFANNIVNTIAVRPDGDVIVGGSFTTMNGVVRNRIARLTNTGALDTTFTGTFANNTVQTMIIQPNEEIIVGGLFTGFNGVIRNYVARLTSTGVLDTTFTGTFANNSVLSMTLQPDGSLILGGTFTTFNGVAKNRLVRLQPTVPTATITTPMSGSSIVERQPLIQGTGNVDGAEISVSYSGGALIGTAVVDGGVRGFFPSSYLITGEQILCASTIYMTGTSCVSVIINDFVESNGELEYTFSGVFANNIIHSIETTLDGEFLAGGVFTGFNGSLRNRLARITTSGSLDTTFTGTFANNTIYSTINQTDGDIVVGGLFTGINGIVRNRLARITFTGALDTTFTGLFANDSVQALLSLPDSKILVGGAFTTMNGIVRNRLARLTTTGALDTTFTGTFANSGVFATAIQPDGDIIVGGAFTTMNGVTRNRLARLTTTGALDTTFTGAFANNTVDTIVIQPDGKILVGGTFTGFNGIVRNRLARLTTTGALDTTFTGTFSNSEINAILTQPDGKILIGGAFTTMNGVTRNRLARLTTTGALDTTFTGTFANSGVNNMTFASNGDIIVGGAFTTFNSVSRNYLVRLTTFIPGIISVGSPIGLTFSSTGISSFAAQTLQQQFTGVLNYFSVDDEKAADSGYNTTIQLSGHLTDGVNIISGSNVLFRSSEAINIISGLPNPRVVLDAGASSFQSLNSPRNFIRRDPETNFNIVGEYGTNIEMRVDVPAAQPPGDYSGIIVYTLIEN